MTDLVVVSLEAWDEVWRRNQHLVAGLLRADPALRVLFVEPPSDPAHDLRRARRPRRGLGLRSGDTSGAHGRLWLLQLTKLLPRRIDPVGDRRLASRIARTARKLAMTRPVLWVNDPSGAEVMRITGWPTLYDVTDDWVAADRAPAERSRIIRLEQELLRSAASVVVCSPTLARIKGRDREVQLVPNAVDLDAYRRSHPRPTDLPRGKVALYLGTVHRDRIDVGLCVATAEAVAGFATVVLVGPALLPHCDTRRLREVGVLLTGPRASDRVPAYLQHADVLLVPHVLTEFTESLDPIKAYEYRAAARPVVSTPVPGFKDGSDPLVVVRGGADFPSAVIDALTRSSPTASGRSAVPTWADRVRDMHEVIGKVGRVP